MSVWHLPVSSPLACPVWLGPIHRPLNPRSTSGSRAHLPTNHAPASTEYSSTQPTALPFPRNIPPIDGRFRGSSTRDTYPCLGAIRTAYSYVTFLRNTTRTARSAPETDAPRTVSPLMCPGVPPARRARSDAGTQAPPAGGGPP
eukprot:1195065-Prorocentrum_minimum.AAC.2